jgi:2-iminobutanoate/2-iminopropanoate deaminase
MERNTVRTSEAPAAIGPYSQAVVVNLGGQGAQKMIFCSGQIALDPATGSFIEGDVVAQTRRVLDNLAAVLAAAGASLANVVKTTIYLQNMDDFAQVNAAYAERFTHEPPARATVQAAKLPRGAAVEIDAIAVI